MTKKYKAILFDYDGTIIDTNQLIIDSWDHKYHKHFGGHLTGDDVKWTFGRVLWDSIDEQMQNMGHSGYDLDELVASYREYQAQPHINPDKVPPFEGIVDLIKELKSRGYLLGIVTSRGKDSCVRGLAWHGILEDFDAFVTAESTDIHKPEPEPALICCEMLGVEPGEALMVGDSVFDLQCGNAAGCDTCFVSWSFATTLEEAAENGQPTYVVDNAEDILSII